ncbi:hypothetical protein CWATWH8502_731 [Crocosphaera watsonii WH 8502]|uniref:Uncharacterized protein n=2 Tax=Crocosphaera watsonii TaxID=263511 RepID=T2J5E1_CROWT|nr:hypothetical protein CWATWH8502_731 [Crocosphaera watsonii WH 8502]CCQ59737.1 hypothetical protein CWATWH0401_304 [Crocosphaera watsonii WH 0401]
MLSLLFPIIEQLEILSRILAIFWGLIILSPYGILICKL